jgi:acyl-CoA thioester hydrolase
MTNAAETRIRVRYAETDQMAVVYYANYLVWMEVGRVELCRAFGFDYRDMERLDGVMLAVAEANCRYHSPARYDDEVIVRAWVESATRKTVTFAYEMSLAAGGRKLASGYTKHVFVGRDFRPTRLPEKYFTLFGIDPRPRPDSEGAAPASRPSPECAPAASSSETAEAAP